jgi:outer membrane lipoprotein-sorting protein
MAFGQGGQTEVTKTTPSNPPAVTAPVIQPPAAKPNSPAGTDLQWQTGVAQPPRGAPAVQESELAIVAKVNDYFNKLTELEGAFVQTDPDNKQKRGRFYFARPGKMRFDYSVPSSLKVISDGRYLAIEDHDMNTSDRYPLDVTPFKVLMSENVDLARDGKITNVEQGPDTIILTVEDKDGESSGRIRLFFSQPDMSLQQWIITDAQGLDTRIEVSNLEQNKQVSENFFELSRTLGFDHDR